MRATTPRIAIAACVAGVAAATWILTGQVSARGNSAPAAQTGTTNHTLTVSGHGQISVAPDMATVNVGVEAKGTSAQEALSKANATMSDVIGAVEGQGIPASHLQTSNLSIYYDSEHDVYVADHQLTVTVDDISKVGPVLDAAVGAGANNSWGVSFGLKDTSASNAAALQAAIADARSRADAMASKLQVTITGVGSASDVSYSSSPVRYAGTVAAPAAPTPVQAGQLTVSADASVVYTFTPQ